MAADTAGADAAAALVKPKMKTGFFARLLGPKYELGKGRVVMISGCRDEETSADSKARLPRPSCPHFTCAPATAPRAPTAS